MISADDTPTSEFPPQSDNEVAANSHHVTPQKESLSPRRFNTCSARVSLEIPARQPSQPVRPRYIWGNPAGAKVKDNTDIYVFVTIAVMMTVYLLSVYAILVMM